MCRCFLFSCETQFKRKQMQYNPRTMRTTNQQQTQINSAPSTLASRRPQRFVRSFL